MTRAESRAPGGEGSPREQETVFGSCGTEAVHTGLCSPRAGAGGREGVVPQGSVLKTNLVARKTWQIATSNSVLFPCCGFVFQKRNNVG